MYILTDATRIRESIIGVVSRNNANDRRGSPSGIEKVLTELYAKTLDYKKIIEFPERLQ
jgi:hypothetical protein